MAAAGATPIRVVVADDHAVFRHGLRSMLTAAGDIEVVAEAHDGSQALRLTELLAPDVTLLDIRMPEMNGLQVMAAMKRRGLSTGLIVLAPDSNVRTLVRAVVYGAAGYFTRSVSEEELIAAVRSVAAGESLLKVPYLNAVLARVLEEDARLEPPSTKKHGSLTPREREVLRLVVQGLTNERIGRALGIRRATVKSHVEHLIGKLNVRDRTEAAVWAVRSGLAGQ